MHKQTIIAAGGLVFNEKNELLMIFRHGKWDLPKGKLNAGESIENCAVREVEEETGVTNIQLKKLIGKTYHEYFDKWVEADVIKEICWYLMKVTDSKVLTPQTEEDIEEVIWADERMIEQCLENTYPNIIEIIKILSNSSKPIL
jgi:ADP-ribose pyrophosphatase YjhB (NUDIX family)